MEVVIIAGRKGGPKTRCSGAWTEAKYRSFIKGNLRRATQKWAPIQECKKEARTRRGFYRCAMCEEEVPASTKEEGSRRRTNNVHVDHIKPVIDPHIGWTTWDDCIEGLFCEKDNLQLLCTSCHKIVTDEEKEIAKLRRQQEKLDAE